MTLTNEQKIALIKSLLCIIDADAIYSIEEKLCLQRFSIDLELDLKTLQEQACDMSNDDMSYHLSLLSYEQFSTVKQLWSQCAFSDGVVPIELQVIINMMAYKEGITLKEKISKEEIKYIVDTFDDNQTTLPSDDFIQRYPFIRAQFDERAFEDEFYKSKDILHTLNLYGFDMENFWYLVLFVKDVVEQKSATAFSYTKSVYETIHALRDAIDSLKKHPQSIVIDSSEEFPIDAVMQYKHPIKLSIREHNYKVFQSDNDEAIHLVAHACDHLLKEHELKKQGSIKPVKVSWTKQLTMFYVLMKRFLTDKNPSTKHTAYSYDGNLLIARVLCVLGWIPKEEAELYSKAYDKDYKPNRKFYNLVKNYTKKLSNGVGYSSAFYQGVDF